MTRKLRAEPSTREIPILIVTAHALERDRDRALASGCDGVIIKPCTPTEIIEGVERAMKRERTLEHSAGGRA